MGSPDDTNTSLLDGRNTLWKWLDLGLVLLLALLLLLFAECSSVR